MVKTLWELPRRMCYYPSNLSIHENESLKRESKTGELTAQLSEKFHKLDYSPVGLAGMFQGPRKKIIFIYE